MRARIIAPKVESGKPFEAIHDYWFTTFATMNPFDGCYRCPKCQREAVFERSCGLLHGAVSIHEFVCPHGHVWEYRQVHD